MRKGSLWIPKMAQGRVAGIVDIILMNVKEDPKAVTVSMMKGKTALERVEIHADMKEHPRVVIIDLKEEILVTGNNALTNATNVSSLSLK